MTAYFAVKLVHILSATVLFGTGLGIAFFMLCSHFTDDPREKLVSARFTVTADYLFTLPAVIVQPLTGAWLIWYVGYNWQDFWIVASIIAYLVVGLCWLPVVRIQIQLKQMLVHCVAKQTPLPDRYHRLFKLWFLLGWPAFAAMLILFFLMLTKPQ